MTSDPTVFAHLLNHESIALGGQVSCPVPGALQLEWMLYPDVLANCPNRIKWEYGAGETKDTEIDSGDFKVNIIARPLGAIIEHKASGKSIRIALDRLSREDGTSELTIQCDKSTRFHGLGEQFVALEHTGRRIVCESADWWNKNWFDPPGWKHSYIPIPFLLTTEGYGLLVQTDTRVAFDLREAGEVGGRGHYRLWIESPAVNLVVIPGDSPKAIIAKFLELTGRPYVPPRWGLAPLLGCGNNNLDRGWNEQMQEEWVAQITKNRIPTGIINDEAWSWVYRDEASPTGYYFHPERYGGFEPTHMTDLPGSIRRNREAFGARTTFHMAPFIGCDSKYLPMLKEKKWIVRRASNPRQFLMGQYNHYFFDFTNPEAVAWWQERVGEMLDLGVAGFFCDFAEADEQLDALYHEGGTGRACGQRYNMLYKQATREVLERKRGNDYYIIGRSGWTGMQSICGLLLGDLETSYRGMRQSIVGMLSQALTGQGVIANNLGGYAGDQLPALYLRWVAFGAFSPMFLIWSSGATGGAPWSFGDPEIIAHYRTLTQWRMRLLPYLDSVMHEYQRELVPPVRPLLLEFPEDPRACAIDDEYMLGPALLVAPVLNDAGHRGVYLPAGSWLDFWTGARFEGGRVTEVDCPIDQIPVYVREGAIVPLESNPYAGDDLASEVLELHVFGTPNGTAFTLEDQGRAVRLEAGGSLRAVTLSAGAIARERIAWVVRACERPRVVTFAGAEVPFEYDDARRTLRVEVPGSGGELRIE